MPDVDENGNPIAPAAQAPQAGGVLVDENGNQVSPTSAAKVGRGVLVDGDGMPLTHGDFLNRYGQTVKRYPGDPISKIEERKKNPPPNARGSVAPADGSSAWDYVGAAVKGVGSMLPDITGGATDPFAITRNAVETGRTAAGYMGKHAGAVGKTQAVVSAVPIVGAPLAALAEPSLAVAENRPPTHEENVGAVEGGATLATMALTPAALRVANILRARGVPVEAPAAAEAPESGVGVERGPIAAPEQPAPASPRQAAANTEPMEGSAPSSAPRPIADVWNEYQQARKDAAEASARVYGDLEARTKGAILPSDAEAAKTSPELAEDLRQQAIRQGFPNQVVSEGEMNAQYDAAQETLRPYRERVAQLERELNAASGEPADSSMEHGRKAPDDSTEVQLAPTANFSSPTPTPSALATIAKKAAPLKEIMDGIAPATASPEAAYAADILRSSKAEIANDATIERVRNKEIAKNFDRAGDEENIHSISEYERTGRFPEGTAKGFAPPGYSEMYRATTDAAHDSLRETYGDDRVGYVENYVRRAFKFGSSADEAKATGVLSNWIGSLSASKSPLKGRVLGVPLDEALATMRNAGIEVRPATTNPEILRQWTVENANQARVYKRAWEDAKSGDLIQFVRQGERIPQGLVELNDRVAKVFRPTGQGMVQTGRWFAEPGVARIFNNAISKGLGGSPTFRAIRALNNSYNQMQLGLSAFHLTGTAINAGISDLSLGLQQLIQGDVASGIRSAGRAAAPGLSFARDLYHGRAFINDLVAEDPAARQVLAEKLNPAGGRLAVDESYRNAALENMRQAWSNGRYLRALGNAPPAVVQKIASPLMDYAIPRVKIGAFLDLADANRQKLPLDASPTEIHRAYQQAWDSIDNRFGQLVHDNLFWNRTAADLAQVGTRSVGWNLGTVREIGGGAVDALHGKITPRVFYSFALPVYAGLLGAAIMYLHTGKAPETARDYFYPQNGLTDSKGRPDRVALPTYMKDVFAYSDHPVTTLEHKASPLVSLAFDLGTNRDYFGDMIRNPDESAARQWYQNGAYALKQFQPFSIQQAAKTWEEGGPLQAGEQFMGFVKAPAEMKQSAEDSEAARERRRLVNERKMERAAERHGR